MCRLMMVGDEPRAAGWAAEACYCCELRETERFVSRDERRTLMLRLKSLAGMNLRSEWTERRRCWSVIRQCNVMS